MHLNDVSVELKESYAGSDHILHDESLSAKKARTDPTVGMNVEVHTLLCAHEPVLLYDDTLSRRQMQIHDPAGELALRSRGLSYLLKG